MTMVVSRRQRIFFRYEGERGAFLLLHHGLLGSHEDWVAAGYVQELAREFRVIVPDARGHGRSDKPAGKEDYGLLQMAEDLIEILNELGIRNSHIVGYGLGALVGFELLRRFPERVRIAILGGESALVTPAVQELYRAEAESLKAMSLADYLKALKDQGRLVRSAEAVDEEQERPAALALLEAIAGWEPAPAERIQVASPLTLFTGAEDPAAGRVEAARAGVSRARLVHFPGLGHARLFQERTQIMGEVVRLLKSGRRDDEGRARGEAGAAGGEGGRPPQQGGDRPRSPSGRREGRYGQRWSDRNPAAGPRAQAGAAAQPGAAVQAETPPSPAASAEEPAPIPGAGPDFPSIADAPEAGHEPESSGFSPASEADGAPVSREAEERRAPDDTVPDDTVPDLGEGKGPAQDAAGAEDAREATPEEEDGWAADSATDPSAPAAEDGAAAREDATPGESAERDPHG